MKVKQVPEDRDMGTVARRKPFWKADAFWFVGMPTILIAVIFLGAFIATAFGH